MFSDPSSLVAVLLRFGHIMFGIIWLGYLFFFSLVNAPFQADIDDDLKAKVNPKLLLRALYWFRWGAMYAFLFGWALFVYKYVYQGFLFEAGRMSNRGAWILFGGLLGTVMWFNVWFVIWPRQKKLLGGLIAGTPPPDAARLAAGSAKASRFNTFASGPLLFAMIVPNNYPGWDHAGMGLIVILGIGFWFGPLKRAFKVKTTV